MFDISAVCIFLLFCFKQKTAYEMRISDWSSDVCSSDLHVPEDALPVIEGHHARARVIMGRLWGQSAPVTTHANTIYADISLQPGGAAPIDADADERAVYLAGGDAALDNMA